MLVALCALGATLGILGRLLLESPEVFLAVVRIASLAAPFLLAVGTVIWLGIRGKRWGLAWWGVTLVLIPVIFHVALLLLLPSGDPLRLLSTRRLIANRLPSEADAPWVWRELERRLASGRLTAEQVDDAVEELIAYMERTKPNGWNQPLAWQRGFLTAAIQTKSISNEVLLELCDAFYGPQPRVQPLPALPEGGSGFQLDIGYGSPWSDDSNLNVELLWNVKKVSLDGEQMGVRNVREFGERWSGNCQGALPAGDHLVSIEFDCAYVDANKLSGLNAAELPTAKWPTPRKRWSTTVTVPLRVQVVNEN
jgi:hypothetical protein